MVSLEIESILSEIMKSPQITYYREYQLQQDVKIDSSSMTTIVSLLLQEHDNTMVYYNGRTHNCDSIGVVDVDGNRIIYLNDGYFDLVNKGIDRMVQWNK